MVVGVTSRECQGVKSGEKVGELVGLEGKFGS